MEKDTIEQLMKLSIEQGKLSVPEGGKLTPKVGAAIYHNGEINSSFRGQKGAGDHAEYTLFEKILNGVDIKGATLFTTLEPCTSRKTHKPCSDWIIEKGIRHVYIGILDPNPKIYNHGCMKLTNAGVEVDYFPKHLREEIMKDNEKFIKQYNANPELKGEVSFNYSNNNGRYIIGNNEFMFETMWSKGSDTSIYIYNDPEIIQTVAIAKGKTEIASIKDGSIYDTSSRYREVHKNEIIVLENINGYFAAIKVLDIKDETRSNNDRDELVFEYVIRPDKTPYFSKED